MAKTSYGIITNQNYNKGFNDGVAHGAKLAKKAVAEEIVCRLETLRNEKGVGPKTWERILTTLELTETR